MFATSVSCGASGACGGGGGEPDTPEGGLVFKYNVSATDAARAWNISTVYSRRVRPNASAPASFAFPSQYLWFDALRQEWSVTPESPALLLASALAPYTRTGTDAVSEAAFAAGVAAVGRATGAAGSWDIPGGPRLPVYPRFAFLPVLTLNQPAALAALGYTGSTAGVVADARYFGVGFQRCVRGIPPVGAQTWHVYRAHPVLFAPAPIVGVAGLPPAAAHRPRPLRPRRRRWQPRPARPPPGSWH
jgi:hypothetical protein